MDQKLKNLLKSKDYDKSFALCKDLIKSNPDDKEIQDIHSKISKLINLQKSISKAETDYQYYRALQNALKIVLNGTYGAFANEYFILSNSVIANSITAQGRDVIKYMLTCIEDYFYNKWHIDTEIHNILGFEYIAIKDDKYWFLNRNYQPIDRPYKDFNTGNLGDILLSRGITIKKLIKHEETVNGFDIKYKYHIHDFVDIKPLDLNPEFKFNEKYGITHYIGKNPISIYSDTDSVSKDTILNTNNGKKTIEDLYNSCYKDGGKTLVGHESVLTSEKILNWSEEKGLYYAPIKRVIRHKVTKEKWKLKLKSGKEIEITGDHSLVVFRDGIKTVVKPNEVNIKTDKILEVYD